MGAFSMYCGLCGGPQRDPHDYDNDNDDDSQHKQELPTVPKKNFRWLSAMRAIGHKSSEIPEFGATTPMSKCFISGTGLGNFSECDNMLVPPDPDLVATRSLSDCEKDPEERADGTGPLQWEYYGLQGCIEITSYFSDNIPVHANCWELLGVALKHVRDLEGNSEKQELTLDEIVEVLLTHIPLGMLVVCTDLPFGAEVQASQGQCWEGGRREHWLLMDFIRSGVFREWVLEFCGNGVSQPPSIGSNSGITTTTTTTATTATLLESLPLELLTQILCSLQSSVVLNLLCTSKTLASNTQAVMTAQEFWKSRFLLEVPFFFEYEEVVRVFKRVDWKELYAVLMRRDAEYDLSSKVGNGEGAVVRETGRERIKYKSPWEDERLDAWRNRRRVWQVLVGVARECWEQKWDEDKDDDEKEGEKKEEGE